jgi:hypothetical protein
VDSDSGRSDIDFGREQNRSRRKVDDGHVVRIRVGNDRDVGRRVHRDASRELTHLDVAEHGIRIQVDDPHRVGA